MLLCLSLKSAIMENLTLKAIMRFHNHPSVSAIRSAFNPQSFSFSKVSIDDVLKKINKLGNGKLIQCTDIS